MADRLTLKNDLEIARDIQHAMLPAGRLRRATGLQAWGLTRPANTVGGDFYDVLDPPDGRVVVTLGDVAGKGSPAALLMALLLAMFRTLTDEGLEAAALAERLNVQVCRHSPASRFITLFFAYVRSGYRQTDLRERRPHPGAAAPRRTARSSGWLGGGVALGHVRGVAATRRTKTVLEPGDTLVMYSDGVTEAENHKGSSSRKPASSAWWTLHAGESPRQLAEAILRVVEVHAQETYLADDLTLLGASSAGPPSPAP